MKLVLRGLVVFLVVLALFVALFYGVENWRGKHAWEKTLAEIKERGEPTTLAEITPPPIPDEVNIAAAPVFAELFLPDGSENKEARLARLSKTELPQQKRRLDPPQFPGTWQLSDLRLYFEEQEGTEGPSPATDQKLAAQALLAQLDKWTPLLEEVREALSRPQCRWPLPYEKGFKAGASHHHLSPTQMLIQIFSLRVQSLLELGESQKAMDDLEAFFRLSRAVESEQTVITNLLGYAFDSMALQLFWNGLVRNQWSEADLLRMPELLNRPDDFAKLRKALLHEQVLMRDMDFKSYYAAMKGFYTPPLSLRVQPSGWFLQEMCSFANYSRRIHDSIDVQNMTIAASVCHEVAKEIEDKKDVLSSWPEFSAKGSASGYLTFIRKVAQMQAMTNQARIALALELWKLRHGRLPEHLDELVPEFLDSVPNQVVDNTQMIYRRVNDQDYLLYSIAWNLQDDGGIVKRDPEVGLLDWVWVSKPELYRVE